MVATLSGSDKVPGRKNMCHNAQEIRKTNHVIYVVCPGRNHVDKLRKLHCFYVVYLRRFYVVFNNVSLAGTIRGAAGATARTTKVRGAAGAAEGRGWRLETGACYRAQSQLSPSGQMDLPCPLHHCTILTKAVKSFLL